MHGPPQSQDMRPGSSSTSVGSGPYFTFPVPGARIAGLVPPPSHPPPNPMLNNSPDQRLNPLLAQLPPQPKIEPHPQVVNGPGPGPDEAYYGLRPGGFPIQGVRHGPTSPGISRADNEGGPDGGGGGQGGASGRRPGGSQINPGASPSQHPLPHPHRVLSSAMQPQAQAQPRSRSMARGISHEDDDPVRPFLEGLAAAADVPQRQAMWTELIRLKTRSLELQIADARAKERAAELELHRLQQGIESAGFSLPTGVTTPGSVSGMQHHLSPGIQSEQTPTSTQPASAPGMAMNAGAAPPPTIQNTNMPNFPFVAHAHSPEVSSANPSYPDNLAPPVQQQQQQPPRALPQPASGPPMAPPAPQPASYQQDLAPITMTPFDLEAILQQNNLENLFAWLPDSHPGGGSGSGSGGGSGGLPHSAAPSDLVMSGSELLGMAMGSGPGSVVTDTNAMTPATPASPIVKRPLSPDSDHSPPKEPAVKKAKPRGEKKMVIEKQAMCLNCNKNIARVLLRAPRSAVPNPILVEMNCPECTGITQLPALETHSAGGPAIGSAETRKRMRAAMEEDDLISDNPMRRRCFCDVCQRVISVGQIVGDADRSSLAYMAEIVCASCDSKYQRCTDCGGGGGPRVGIGKWRLKQVFQPGRKTCSLSHSRLGDRPREIGVHVTPTDFTPEQLKEVIVRCKTLWNEKTLSRLAVPEMLEIDLPPHVANPLRNFGDVDDIVNRCWPSREAMIRAEGVDPNRFKRLLGLTWAHSRPRRSVRTVDLEEEYARHEAEGSDDMSTVLANVKRTNVVIPPGSELIGMWGGEWDMQHGSLLISTFIPFEGTDGEDSTALSVGELITKVQQLQQQMNAERMVAAVQLGQEPELVRPCEHLWVVSGGSMPLIRERMADILVRKRSFVHVDEYLTRHPDFLEALQARPIGLHPDSDRPLPHQVADDPNYVPPKPLILVRWLGKDFDAQRILEIKQMEFGGGKQKKLKRMPKSKV